VQFKSYSNSLKAIMKNENSNNLNSLPSLVEIEKIIYEIKNANFEKLSFNKLFRKIQSLQFTPFPTTILRKGYYIERARINKPNEIFVSESDISYRTDFENITKYGRANTIGNSLFYGSFESKDIELARFVSLLEISEIFRNLEDNSITDTNFIMTVGKWKILSDIKVAEVVFDEESIKNSEEIQKSFEYHIKLLKKDHPKHIDKIELILRFFSNQFAKKKINTHHDYMVSAIYSYLAIENGLRGVKYPSVRADYKGHNIVLSPTIVENYLDLEVASMFRVIKKGKQTLVTPIKNCVDFGYLNTNFTWKDI